MDDKEFGDHLASNPKGDPRNVARGSIRDMRDSERVPTDRVCDACRESPEHAGQIVKQPLHHLPISIDGTWEDGIDVCGACLKEMLKR